MKPSAVLSVLARCSDTPFWLGRELGREKARLLAASGFMSGARFQAPPLAPAFGPGTAFPEGVRPTAADWRRCR